MSTRPPRRRAQDAEGDDSGLGAPGRAVAALRTLAKFAKDGFPWPVKATGVQWDSTTQQAVFVFPEGEGPSSSSASSSSSSSAASSAAPSSDSEEFREATAEQKAKYLRQGYLAFDEVITLARRRHTSITSLDEAVWDVLEEWGLNPLFKAFGVSLVAFCDFLCDDALCLFASR